MQLASIDEPGMQRIGGARPPREAITDWFVESRDSEHQRERDNPPTRPYADRSQRCRTRPGGAGRNPGRGKRQTLEAASGIEPLYRDLQSLA